MLNVESSSQGLSKNPISAEDGKTLNDRRINIQTHTNTASKAPLAIDQMTSTEHRFITPIRRDVNVPGEMTGGRRGALRGDHRGTVAPA